MESPADWYTTVKATIGLPLVVRPANQGSSIGVRILSGQGENAYNDFVDAVNAAFFEHVLERTTWQALDAEAQTDYVRRLTDIRSGIGLPVSMQSGASATVTIYQPAELLAAIGVYFADANEANATLRLSGLMREQKVIVEEFIEGKEFSCIVVRKANGEAVALPPTEIVKGGEVFDYRSKYLAGLARKITPINLPDHDIERIRKECSRLFEYLEFNVYARIDGFIRHHDGQLFLNDPNTTSGMLPSSFFFHQAAEIGLNPSQFLTYIIHQSLAERIGSAMTYNTHHASLLEGLGLAVRDLRHAPTRKRRIGVILGGYSSERHISVESGRNVYEKLASSGKYAPIPIFLMRSATPQGYTLYQIPVNLLLKDNADDIRDKILEYERGGGTHAVVERIRVASADLTDTYAALHHSFTPERIDLERLAERVDSVFIALHGRPGEDGDLQTHLERLGIPYNGSRAASAAITIDKYDTLQRLGAAGLPVTAQKLVSKAAFADHPQTALDGIEAAIAYPLIAKPVDDGCSSAVKKIRNREQLTDYLTAIFRDTDDNGESIPPTTRARLGLKPREEFPAKTRVLLEALISAEGAEHFLEVTGGLLTRRDAEGKLVYTMFEPSETLADGEVLSLEEKFLAGEGQNITPARFAADATRRAHLSTQVRKSLRRAAETLCVEGYARIDAFVRVRGDVAETIVIEVNSLPGMTPATCIFHQCALEGMKPYDFIDAILEYGFERQK